MSAGDVCHHSVRMNHNGEKTEIMVEVGCSVLAVTAEKLMPLPRKGSQYGDETASNNNSARVELQYCFLYIALCITLRSHDRHFSF